MINSFLVTLTNTATPPVNPASDTGSVLWPDIVQVREYEGTEAVIRQLLFGDESDGLTTLLNAIRYLWLVEHSVLSKQITADDPRVSYTRAQLEAQFIGVATDLSRISQALRSVDSLPVHDFLGPTELGVWRSALAAGDRLAAVIVHFGRRNGP